MRFYSKGITVGLIAAALVGGAVTHAKAATVNDTGVTEPRALVYNYFYGPQVRSLLRDNQHVLCDACPRFASLSPYAEEAKIKDVAKNDPPLIPFVAPVPSDVGDGLAQKASSVQAGQSEIEGYVAYFGFDRHVLSRGERKSVESYLDNFKAAGGDTVRVEGHTCDIGPRAYNQKLSELRAKAVARIATEKGFEVSGVSGFGETQPVSTVRAKNRIAVIFVKEGVLKHEN